MRKYLPILCFLPLVAGYAHAADSTTTIKGYLKDNACSVSVDSQDFTVDLLSNVSSNINRIGAVTPVIPFKIVIDKCSSSAKAVRVRYTGTSDTVNTSLLQVATGINTASGVGIQILDSGKTPIRLNAAQSSLKWNTLTPNKSNTLDYYARLMVTRTPVRAGKVTATANFTLEYQ
ncbi:fimbrial protein [Serratia nevei]|uniref:fimbrial protein n=1 Tax=Serratia nevei TaxID=2703794 RepID=UPI003FA68AFA